MSVFTTVYTAFHDYYRWNTETDYHHQSMYTRIPIITSSDQTLAFGVFSREDVFNVTGDTIESVFG